jgi:single-stranded DNA-binding protein
MTNLNSVLIEGDVNNNPELHYNVYGNAELFLRIKHNRFWKEDGEYCKETSHFSILITDHKKAEFYAGALARGVRVRVVGRLDAPASYVRVVAEHIEIVPIRQTA